MDLSTVEKKLLGGAYSGTVDFANDVRKIWSNSFTYNGKGNYFIVHKRLIPLFFENNSFFVVV